MNLTDPPSLGLIGSQFSIVHLIPSFTLCRQRLLLSTPHGVLKGFQIWSKIFCLLPLFFYSMFGRTAPWNCLRLDFQDKSVFFFFFVVFFPFLFFTPISRSISSAMISLPSGNKKNLIRGSDITE